MTGRKLVLIVASVSGLLFPRCAAAQVNVLTYHNDNARTGANLNETLLTPWNVSTNTFGKLFVYSVDGYVYAQPLYISGLNIPGLGTHNVVFVATQHNTVYAFDADSNTGPSAGLLWQVNLGPSAATPNDDFGTRYGGYTAIVPEVGITGTPAIDLASGTLFVDAFTHEGSDYFHKLHALNITNGLERTFSPVLVSASITGRGAGSTNGVLGFQAKQQIQRSALTLAGGILYAAYGGYDDTNPYHGWVIGFDASNLQQLTNYVFNSTPNSTVATYGTNAGEGGIWMAGCGLSVDASTNLFFVTGNGTFNALNGSGGTEYGDSFIRLSTANGLAVADYFTPYNQAYLSSNDLDVGSGGLLLLPDQAGPFPHLMVGGGKQGKLYLINRDVMTAGNNHYSSTTDFVVQRILLNGAVLSTPAYFDGKLYCAASGDMLAAFPIANGLISTNAYQTGPRAFSYPGATPSISANGTNHGVVWAVQRANPAVLTAYDATNLTTEIYNSSQAAGGRDELTNGVKFAVPTIANGKVYVGGQYALSVFGLLQAPYEVWKFAHFASNANNPSIAGDLADPDGDGVINVLEYALASDPNQPETNSWIATAIVSGHFQLRFNRNAFATDLTYTVQTTDALDAAWTDLLNYTSGAGWITNVVGCAVAESTLIGSAPDQPVAVTITDTLASQFAFYRIKVARSLSP